MTDGIDGKHFICMRKDSGSIMMVLNRAPESKSRTEKNGQMWLST